MKPLRRLTASERVIAWRLASGRLVRHEELAQALYKSAEDVSETSIKVMVSRLRKALDCTDIAITAQHGVGYEVSPDSLEQFRSLLAQEIEDNVHIPYQPRIDRDRYNERHNQHVTP